MAIATNELKRMFMLINKEMVASVRDQLSYIPERIVVHLRDDISNGARSQSGNDPLAISSDQL